MTISSNKVKSALHLACLEYVAAAWPIIPIHPGSKRPVRNAWQLPANKLQTAEEVDALYADGTDYNLAFEPEDMGMAVVDADLYHEGCDYAAENLPETYEVETPRGGTHFYFAGSVPSTVGNPAKRKEGRLGDFIDTRGRGGFVLLPPSITADGKYVIKAKRPFATLPLEVEVRLTPAQHRYQAADPDFEADLPGNVFRARERLKQLVIQGRVARAGHYGHDICYGVCAEIVRDLGISAPVAEAMILELWYPHCQPNDNPDFVRERVRSATTSGQNKIGAYAVRPAAEVFAGATWVKAIAAAAGADLPYKYPGPMTARELVNGVFPQTAYMMQGFVMELVVNLISGDGGVGKTTLAEHMAVAVAGGIPLFGRETKQAPTLLVLGEDGYGDTKARLEAISQHLGLRLEDLPLTTWCLPGEDITLAEVTDMGGITYRPFYRELAQRLDATRGTFVTLDSLIDIGILNESQRGGMNAFMKKVVGGLCNQFQATPLVLGHPSKASMADGTYYSGTTAVKNSVRNQLIMKQPNKGLLRTLEIGRQSYGGMDSLDLIWTPGSVFKTRNDAGVQATDKEQAEEVISLVLGMIDQGLRVIQSNNGNGQKPKDIVAELEKRGRRIDQKTVAGILSAAVRSGELVYNDAKGHSKAGYGRPSPGAAG